MSQEWTCTTCGVRGDDDVENAPFFKAYLALLNGWKWALFHVVLLIAAIVVSVLKLPAREEAVWVGVVLGMILVTRPMQVKRCRKCESLLLP